MKFYKVRAPEEWGDYERILKFGITKHLPEVDGLVATREIVADPRLETVKVVMLTTFDLDEYVFEALRAGASGFLLKRAPAEDLIAGIRIVAAGEALLAPSVTRRLIDHFASRRESASLDTSRLRVLTERERKSSSRSPRACLTPKSPNASSSPRARSRRTSSTSSTSSRSTTAPRP